MFDWFVDRNLAFPLLKYLFLATWGRMEEASPSKLHWEESACSCVESWSRSDFRWNGPLTSMINGSFELDWILILRCTVSSDWNIILLKAIRSFSWDQRCHYCWGCYSLLSMRREVIKMRMLVHWSVFLLIRKCISMLLNGHCRWRNIRCDFDIVVL